MKLNIAIDGPSASGKSTIAKALAKRLNYTHLDTGAMYRACTYKALKNKINTNSEDDLVKMVNDSHFTFDDLGHIHLDGKDISAKIRSKDIDLLTSTIAQFPKLRESLVHIQQTIAKDKGYILDGRDIGSVVLPDAEVKIFQTASIESRAKRRYKDYKDKGIDIDYQTIYDEIKLRDAQDQNRMHSPLIKTDDAYLLDTSELNIEESVEKVYEIVLLKLKERSD
jgi:cytidylate kinase